MSNPETKPPRDVEIDETDESSSVDRTDVDFEEEEEVEDGQRTSTQQYDETQVQYVNDIQDSDGALDEEKEEAATEEVAAEAEAAEDVASSITEVRSASAVVVASMTPPANTKQENDHFVWNHELERENILRGIMPMPMSPLSTSCDMVRFFKSLPPQQRQHLERTTLQASQRGEGNPGAFATMEPSYHLAIDRNNTHNDSSQIHHHSDRSEGAQASAEVQDTRNQALGLQEYELEDGLARARIVNDNLQVGMAVVTMEPGQHGIDEAQQDQKNKMWRIFGKRVLLGLVLCLAIGLGIALLEARRANSSGSDASDEDSMHSTTITLAPIMEVSPLHHDDLLDSTWDAILHDSKSSQALAYLWLSQDPNLEQMPNPQRIQRFALATLYYACSGQNWIINQDWLDYKIHECNWFSKVKASSLSPVDFFFNNQHSANYSLGQTLCNEKGQYVSLVLPANDLRGTLPPEVSLLSNLQSIDLTNNPLHGSFPTELGLINTLRGLFLGATGYVLNTLTGSIPSSLGLLTNLEYFYAFGVDFTGTLPSELANWHNIRQWTLMASSITGTLPTGLYQLTTLEHYGFADNIFPGLIGSEMGSLQELDFMGSEYHVLTWILQDHIMSSSSTTNASLHGSLHTELGLMTRLKDLYFGVQTNLSGTIPSEIGLCQDLVNLQLGHQRLSGSVPAELFQISSLESLILTGNPNLTGGSIPSELGLATNLQWLDLGRSNFSGSLPSDLETLANLYYLDLQGNPLLTGKLPFHTFSNLSMYASMKINNTGLTGTLPDAVCDAWLLWFDCPKICGCGCTCKQ